MASVIKTDRELRLPDHTDLPDSDDEMENPHELPQSMVLTDSIQPILRQRHPDNQFFVGSNSGIYWTLTEPPRRGAIAPDWFYVPNVAPSLIEGRRRRSYVMWKEVHAPLIALEFVSDADGAAERDRTPNQGKFWIYENAVKAEYYGIYEVDPGVIELYELIGKVYQPIEANERGHYPIARLGVELGLWEGRYFEQDLPWLRWWDDQGRLLLTGQERADHELERADQEHQRADQELERADQEHQRADHELERADQEHQRADQEHQRADQEHQRADQEHQRAERERERAERLAERLRALGIDPNEL